MVYLYVLMLVIKYCVSNDVMQGRKEKETFDLKNKIYILKKVREDERR